MNGPVRLRYHARLDVDVDLDTGQVVRVGVSETGIHRDRKHRASRPTTTGHLACPPHIAQAAITIADTAEWPAWHFTTP